MLPIKQLSGASKRKNWTEQRSNAAKMSKKISGFVVVGNNVRSESEELPPASSSTTITGTVF